MFLSTLLLRMDYLRRIKLDQGHKIKTRELGSNSNCNCVINSSNFLNRIRKFITRMITRNSTKKINLMISK